MNDATTKTQGNGADEALRRAILDELLSEAAFEGFTRQTLDVAAKRADLPAGSIEEGLVDRLFPGGIGDVLAFWSEEEDRAMVEAFEAENPKPHGITKKIRWLVKQRIEQLDWNREAARRAAATLALPHHGGLGAKLVWQTADAMWRATQDKSTDFNWYSKRMTLSAVYTSTLANWFGNSGDAAADDPYAETWAFLDARLGNLMSFEKFKGRVTEAAPDPADIVGFLGRFRYGSGK
ncbi:COQ9 family protein [Parvularcula sp. ZS-1/3]|uniref:COQ9 family protein n=1 Tax=Parvularcula mediterranea TaxID=2732508 RepID=A0A7Y3W6C3_9PROT|nr:COQ9 family protein [Parvularcula mediterranea]NNU17197.1 COQ9 family protein [Parvularcula mediterranea]